MGRKDEINSTKFNSIRIDILPFCPIHSFTFIPKVVDIINLSQDLKIKN